MHQKQFYVGVDWASQSHHVCVLKAAGDRLGEQVFKHTGEADRRSARAAIDSQVVERGRDGGGPAHGHRGGNAPGFGDLTAAGERGSPRRAG